MGHSLRSPALRHDLEEDRENEPVAPEVAPIGIELGGPSDPGEPGSLLDEIARASPPPPADPPDDGELPFGSEMEAAFGEDFAGVEIVLGRTGLGALGANAVASKERVTFASARPDRRTVAHELVHVVQARRHGAGDGAIDARSDGAETEADTVAARVASGAPAGNVGEAPSAALHRDAAPGPVAAPVIKVLNYIPYTILPDAAYEAAKKEARLTATTLSETGYRARIDALGLELLNTAVKLHDLNPIDWLDHGKVDLMRAINAAPAEVQASAFRQISAHPAAQADVSLAQKLVRDLDPLAELREILSSSSDTPDKLGRVQAWAKRFGPETCKRVVRDGDLQVKLNLSLGQGPSVVARLYIIGAGEIRDDPYTQMQLGMCTKNGGIFLSNWARMKLTDPQQALALGSDATFLEDVRTWVPEAYPTVLDDIRALGAPKAAADPQEALEREALVPIVRPVAAEITRAIEDTGPPIAMFGEDDAADAAFAAAATRVYTLRRDVLARQVVDVSTEEGRAAALRIERRAVEVLRSELDLGALRDYGTGAGRAPFMRAIETADYELGKRALRDSGQTDLSAEETAAVRAVAERIAARLAAIGSTDFDGSDRAKEVLAAFSADTAGSIRAGTGKGREAAWTESERRRKADTILDEVFRARTGRSIAAWLGDLGGGHPFFGAELRETWGDRKAEKSIEDDPDAYSDVLTDLDRKRLRGRFEAHADTLGPIAKRSGQRIGIQEEVPAGMNRTGNFQSGFFLRANRAFVASDLASLESSVRDIVEPVRREGPFLAAWERKVRNAMRTFEQDLSANHGSLRSAVDTGGGDGADQRAALVALGDRDESTFGLQQQALSGIQGDATAAHKYLQAFAPQVEAIARTLASTLAPAMTVPPVYPQTTDLVLRVAIELGAQLEPTVDEQVSDSTVLMLASTFSTLAASYPNSVPGGKPGDATTMLNTAFAPLGGSLAPLIVRGLGPDNADTALSRFGITYRGVGGTTRADLAQVRSGEPTTARAETDATFAARLETRAIGFSRRLASLVGEPGTPDRDVRFVGLTSEARDLMGLARLAEGGPARLQKLWQDRVGVALDADLGRHLRGDAERNTMAAVFGVAVKDLSGHREPSYYDIHNTLADPRDPYAFLRKAGVSPDQVSPEFDVYLARRRAIELHFALGRLPGSEREIVALAKGPAGEMKVVTLIYRDLYGYDPMYRLRQVFPDDPTSVDRFADRLTTSGSGSQQQQLLAYAREKDLKEILKLTLRMPPSERIAVARDTEVLAQMRARLGEGDYAHWYATLSGKADLYDVIRADEDVPGHIEAYFVGRRATLKEDPELRKQAGDDPKKLDALVEARVQQEGRVAYADPSMRKLLDEKFGETKDFEVRARLLGGGVLSSRDKMTKAVVDSDDTDEDALQAAGAAFDAGQQAAFQRSAMDQRRVASDLEEQDGDVKHARRFFAQTGGAPGQGGMAKLEEARRSPFDPSKATEIDREKGMAAVLGMSHAELGALMADPATLERLRDSLRFDPARLARLDGYLAAARKLTAKDHAAFLVERYVVQFLENAGSAKNCLRIAQECYNEKGLVPGPKPTDKPIPTFGKDQRKLVWDRVVGMTVVDPAVTGALLHGIDPTSARLALGFDGKDQESEILAAIENASIKTVIEWSNVLVAGPTQAYGSLKEKFEAFVAINDTHTKASQNKDVPMDPKLEEQFLAARNRFWDHRLDFSEEALTFFADGGGDTFELKISGIGTGQTFKDRPDKKLLLKLKGAVRKRVLGLTNEDVAPGLGVVEPPEPKPTGDPEKDLANHQAYLENRRNYDDLISADRVARSEIVQRDDVYAHERGDGRSVAAGQEGRRVDIAHDIHHGDLDRGLGDGRLDAGEVDRLKRSGGDFDRKVQEYKDAKAKIGGILKFIAKALILAIAVALTGPAGLGILGTLLVAGAGAMADNLIDSAVMGNDFDWQKDGMSHLTRELSIAALTFGLGKVFKAASGPLGVKGAVDKVAAFEQQLASNATQSFRGLVTNYAFQAGKSVVTAPLSAISAGVVDILDPAEWKYGFGDWSSFAHETMGTQFDAMGDSLKGDLLESLATTALTFGRGKLSRRPAPGLPGVSTPTTPRDVGLGNAVRKHAGDALMGLTDEALKLVARKVAAGQAEAGLSWSEDEVLDYLSRVTGRGLKRGGTAIAAQRNGSRVAEVVKKAADGKVLAQGDLDHYRVHLEGGSLRAFGKVHEDPAAFKAQLDAKRAQVIAAAAKAKDPEAGKAYLTWVFAAPEELQGRLTVGVDAFEARYTAGQQRLGQIRSSDAYKQLGNAERTWFERSAGDTSAVLELGKGKSALALDAAKGVDKFRGAARETAVAQVSAQVADLTVGWDTTKRRAFDAELRRKKLDDLSSATSDNHETAQIHATRLALQFSQQYEVDAAKRVAGTKYAAKDAPEVTVPKPRSSVVRAGPDDVTGKHKAVIPPPGFELDHQAADMKSAMAIYKQRVKDHPGLEVGVYYDIDTGVFVVVRGTETSVNWPRLVGNWALVEHWHPVAQGGSFSEPIAKFPSADADLEIMRRQAQRTGEIAMSAVGSRQSWGDTRTIIGFDPHANDGRGAYFVDYGVGKENGKEKRHRREFLDLDEYKTFLDVRSGDLHEHPDPGGPVRPMPRTAGAGEPSDGVPRTSAKKKGGGAPVVEPPAPLAPNASTADVAQHLGKVDNAIQSVSGDKEKSHKVKQDLLEQAERLGLVHSRASDVEMAMARTKILEAERRVAPYDQRVADLEAKLPPAVGSSVDTALKVLDKRPGSDDVVRAKAALERLRRGDLAAISDLESVDLEPPIPAVGDAIQRARSRKAADDELTTAKKAADNARAVVTQEVQGPRARITEIEGQLATRRKAVLANDADGSARRALDAAEAAKRDEQSAYDRFKAAHPTWKDPGVDGFRERLRRDDQFVDADGSLKGWARVRPLDLVAHPSRSLESTDVLDPKDPKVKAQLEGRESARSASRAATDRNPRKDADKLVRDASEELGVLAADAYAAKKGWRRPKPDELDPKITEDGGAHFFDRLYFDASDNLVVCECKGGGSKKGGRGVDSGEQAQQGSRAYVQQMVDQLRERELKADAARAKAGEPLKGTPNADLLQRLLKAGRIRSYVISQPFKGDGTLQQTKVQEYDVQHDYGPNGKIDRKTP